MRIVRDRSGTPWEASFGYARAVRAGGLVAVSATAAADPDGRALAPDPLGQAREALKLVERSLVRLGSRLDHVLRLRVYYVDPAIGPDVQRAFAEAFDGAVPALTTVRVAGLADPAFHLEIEADAVVPGWEADPSAARDPGWDEPVD